MCHQRPRLAKIIMKDVCAILLKTFETQLTTNCLSVFHHFVGLVLKGFDETGHDKKSVEANFH